MLYVILLLFPFLTIIFPIGIFHEANWSFFGLWLVAGISIILNSESKTVGFLPIGFFILSLFGILGVLQNGLTSLVGINEIREGTVTFLSLAIILATVQPKHTLPSWVCPILYSIITIFGFYGWKYLGWKTYVFLDISAFTTLASVPMYVSFRSSISSQYRNLCDAFCIASFLCLIYYSDNDAATLACGCAAMFVFLLPLAKKYFNFLPKNDGFYIVGGLSLIALLVIISWKYFSYLPLQLQSRTLLGIVTILQYFDDLKF